MGPVFYLVQSKEALRLISVPLRLCQCERAPIRFAAAESEGLARSILDRTSALTALAGPRRLAGEGGCANCRSYQKRRELKVLGLPRS